MIGAVLEFLRTRLNSKLPRDAGEGAAADLFVYASTDKPDSIGFTADAVSILFLGIEEDNVLRPPDRFARIAPDGARQKVEPEIRLNLNIMFVARFPLNYRQALDELSRVIRYFQTNRVLTPANSPDLPSGIPQLVLELVAPSFAEQNEVWGALRSPYQPSVMYRLRLLVFRDDEPQLLPAVKSVDVPVRHMASSA